jgi:hypothetical protein
MSLHLGKRLAGAMAVVLISAFCMSAPAHADGQPGKFGLGFELGDPYGFNAKLWLNRLHAMDFVMGWHGLGYGNGPRGYGYDRCYDNGFYNANRGYCDGAPYFYDGRYDGYGWDIFHFHVDYLIHNFNLIHATIPIPVYYGFGVQYEYWKSYYYTNWLGMRGTIGLDFMPRTIPFDFFFELAPVFYVLPGPQFAVNGGIGARFWF